jgi:hypothetical protein
MRRIAAALAVAFVASLTLASYGHCWPMFSVQVAQLIAPHGHDGHEGGEIPAEDSGPELATPAVESATPAISPPTSSNPPVLILGTEEAAVRVIAIPRRALNTTRAGPSAFRDIHARTGRLLI